MAPLDANFDTKLASLFLHFYPKRDAENKSSRIESALKVQYLMGSASFQEIERFSVVPQGDFKMASGRRFLCSFSQNASTLDDYLQSSRVSPQICHKATYRVEIAHMAKIPSQQTFSHFTTRLQFKKHGQNPERCSNRWDKTLKD